MSPSNKIEGDLRMLGLSGGDFMPGMIDYEHSGGGLVRTQDEANFGNIIPMGGKGVLKMMGGNLEKFIFNKMNGGGVITLSDEHRGGAIRMPMEYFGMNSDHYHADGGSGVDVSFSPYESPGYQSCGVVGGAITGGGHGVFKQKDLYRLSKEMNIELPKDKPTKLFILSRMNAYLKSILHHAKGMSKSGKITRANLKKIMKEKK